MLTWEDDVEVHALRKRGWSISAIARHTGMGGSWIGLVLMATVTSLPELATGISSAATCSTWRSSPSTICST